MVRVTAEPLRDVVSDSQPFGAATSALGHGRRPPWGEVQVDGAGSSWRTRFRLTALDNVMRGSSRGSTPGAELFRRLHVVVECRHRGALGFADGF